MAVASQSADETLAGLTSDEFVRSLSDSQKDAVLSSLLREAMRRKGGKSVIAMNDPHGEQLGFFVPPAAAHVLAGPPVLSPERVAAIRRAMSSPEKTVDVDQLLDEISLEDQD